MKRERGPEYTGETIATGTVQAGTAGRAAAFFQNELFVDIVACLFLASGLTMALTAITTTTTLTMLEGGLWRILGLTAASLAVVVLLRMRWWLTPAAAAVLLAGTAVYHLAVRDFDRRLEYWTGFLRWAQSGAAADGIYSESGGPLLLEAALAFAVVLAVFALVRRLFAFTLVLGITAAVMIWTYAVERTDLSVALCFAAAGLIVLLPRVYARYVRQNSEGAARRGSMQSVAVPAAMLALLLACVIIPEDTGVWRSRSLNNLVTDVGQLLGGPFETHASYASNFSMTMTGFQPDNGRLGGPVTLSDARVAVVTAGQPALLRGAVRDYYTGESWWMGAPDGDFRYKGLFWRRYRREAYDLDKPAGSEARKLFDSLTNNTEMRIQYVDNRFSALFAAGRVRNVAFPGQEPQLEAYFNVRGELYTHARVPANTRVNIESTLWQPRTSAFDDGFLQLERLTASDTDQRYEQIRSRYTQLPDTLTASVRETADEITAGLESPYEKARAIEAWLRENCSYTLAPSDVPEGADFVAHFLETREGYCVYYASAMAVMARCAGLPSRYVTGFALERFPGVTDGYLATERTAHAWAEIYFRGIGWVEFDPLSWDVQNPLNTGIETERTPEQATAVFPGRPDERVPAGSGLVPEIQEADRGIVSFPMLMLAALGVVVLCVLVWAMLRAVMTSKLRGFRMNRVMRRFPDMTSRMEHYYADILRQLRLLELEPRPGETLNTFPARVDRRIRIEDGTLTGIAGARMRTHFAGIEPTAPEVEAACRYHEGLELYLRERLGRTAYFFRRAIKQV